MIKANELRIGNLFLNKEGKVETVEGIINDTWEQRINPVMDYSIEEMQGYSFEEVNPIPLTEESLLKYGFKKILHHIEGSNLKDEYDLGYIRVSRFLGSFYFQNIQIKSVHRLQNLYFALTGEELMPKQQ